MRTLSILALTLLVTATLVPPPAAALVPEVRFPDGFTAKLTFPGSIADMLLMPDADGNIAVEVSIYDNAGGTWGQRATGATLRVFGFTGDAAAPEADLVSEYFTSSDTGPVTVTFPASDLTGVLFYDVFITWADTGLNPPPTSHHNPVKNLLIDNDLFNTADYLDYNLAPRVIHLGAPAVPGLPPVEPPELPPLPPLPLPA